MIGWSIARCRLYFCPFSFFFFWGGGGGVIARAGLDW